MQNKLLNSTVFKNKNIIFIILSIIICIFLIYYINNHSYVTCTKTEQIKDSFNKVDKYMIKSKGNEIENLEIKIEIIPKNEDAKDFFKVYSKDELDKLFNIKSDNNSIKSSSYIENYIYTVSFNMNIKNLNSDDLKSIFGVNDREYIKNTKNFINNMKSDGYICK